jgi:hypothetical protein
MQRDDAGRFVLDRLDVPDGRVALVAFEERGTVQVGVARDPGDLVSSIEVGRDSFPYEPAAWRQRGWAVAFGGMPTSAVRAEVRNEDGEAFPAAILPLPAELGTHDQVAWGLAERWEDDCVLVGFDERGEHVTTFGEFAVAPRTTIAEGEDPVGGRWRLSITHWNSGPGLELRTAWGRSTSVIGQLPANGFGTAGWGHHELPDRRAWDVKGLVSAFADRVEVTTRVGPRPAVVLRVPSRELGPCKAYVAFFPEDEQPLALRAFDAGGTDLATLDLTGR